MRRSFGSAAPKDSGISAGALEQYSKFLYVLLIDKTLHMKKTISMLVLAAFVMACSKNKEFRNSEIIGTWRLTEMLADPGDGSGTFQPVQSDKTITFHKDGTISSNGSLCVMSTEVDGESSGMYSFTDSSFSANNCVDPAYRYRFSLQGDVVIVDYPCIEPCRSKFVRQ